MLVLLRSESVQTHWHENEIFFFSFSIAKDDLICLFWICLFNSSFEDYHKWLDHYCPGKRTSLMINLCLQSSSATQKKYCRLHMHPTIVDLDGISRGFIVCYSSMLLIKVVPNPPNVKKIQNKTTPLHKIKGKQVF